MIGRLLLAVALSGSVALCMTWGLFSIPVVVNAITDSDSLLVLWYLLTIATAMVIFWLVMVRG